MDAEADGQSDLRVYVDEQYALTSAGEPDAEIDGADCFAHAAFLLGNGNDLLRMGASSFL